MPTQTQKKKRILLPLLLLAVAALAVSAWQWRAAAQEQDDSDAQTRMKPETQEYPPLMDFTGLQAQNPDIIAWITIEALGIDYPVVQGKDNSYYLNHTAQNITNKLGALFLDFRARRDFTDFNSVIYGHYIESGKMFRYLSRMRDADWFGRVTQGLLYTPGKTYRLEFFAAALADSRSDFYQYAFPSPYQCQSHLDMIRAKAAQYRDIGMAETDRLLTLSTCSYEYDGARTLVIARLAG